MDTTNVQVGDAVLIKRIANPTTKQYWAIVLEVIAIGFKVSRIPIGPCSNFRLPTWVLKEEVIEHRSNQRSI